ncbi:hypothetical protein AF335_06945 [Streptomyces eurocidicus]|uniref:Uncharacterized protein n=1 Tax=Streptomyces eurocidicus TaxID=66423 RepID=A0A2N8P008_STREU|nr:hypothetical protein [Streptomyces eurocidicus]MBB5118870.1 hypothetical protein [Streptomyces eurocidicus]MBF6051322.1 hypothetical protein [Streptomyces eurocidicus]PNE34350.1 hypothetical protein AF335_06945 [Streptomyces eurocidicus]
MVMLIFRLLAEAVAGSVVTWILSHLGDLGTFVGLLGSGGLLGGTIFFDKAQAGLARFGAAVVVFVAPFFGANAYERHEGKPIAAVVAEEPRTGTTWGKTGGSVLDKITSNDDKPPACPGGGTSPGCGGTAPTAPSAVSTRSPSPGPGGTPSRSPSAPPSPTVPRSPSPTAPPSPSSGTTNGMTGGTTNGTTNGMTGGTEGGGRTPSPTARRTSPPPVPNPNPDPAPNGDRNSPAGPPGGPGAVPDRARSGVPTP